MLAATPAAAAPSADSSGTAGSVQVAVAPTNPTAALNGPVDAQTQAFRDQLKAKQARLDTLKSQLDQLDQELEIATESLNQAQDKLDALRSEIATAQGDLKKADDAYQVQADLLAKRATEIYRTSDTNTVELILASKSIPDFIQRLDFLGVIGAADANLASQLQAQRDSIRKTNDDLELQRQQAEAAQFDLAARKREIELRISDRQATLLSAQSDLLGMLGAEAARRTSTEAALFKSIIAGAASQGIVVAPGSPVETALAYHGVPYLWAGATPAGFDCSGLVLYVFAQHGVILPHYSGSQFLLGEKIDPSVIQPNDVVFFGSPVHHVGIYVGGGYFIEAPHTGDFVKISPLADRSDLAGVRRYAWQPRIGPPAGLNQISPSVDHSHGVQGIYRSGASAR